MKRIELFLFTLMMLCLCACGTETADYDHHCRLEIECLSVLEHEDLIASETRALLPDDCMIFPETEVAFADGETPYDVLLRVCRENKIQLESADSSYDNSKYIEGMANLYNGDAGSSSGWCYLINGEFAMEGCSSYVLQEGDVITFEYSCVFE